MPKKSNVPTLRHYYDVESGELKKDYSFPSTEWGEPSENKDALTGYNTDASNYSENDPMSNGSITSNIDSSGSMSESREMKHLYRSMNVDTSVLMDDGDKGSMKINGVYQPTYTKYWWNEQNEGMFKEPTDESVVKAKVVAKHPTDSYGRSLYEFERDQYLEKRRAELILERERLARIGKERVESIKSDSEEWNKVRYDQSPYEKFVQSRKKEIPFEKLEEDLKNYKDAYIQVQKLRDDARRELTRTVRLNEKLEKDNKILRQKLELLETNPDEYKRRQILDPFNEENWEEM